MIFVARKILFKLLCQKSCFKSPASKHTQKKKEKKKSLIPREDCYSDRIVLFRSMQNQSHSQMVFRLAPAG